MNAWKDGVLVIQTFLLLNGLEVGGDWNILRNV